LEGLNWLSENPINEISIQQKRNRLAFGVKEAFIADLGQGKI
jgi:hypothetical protein